jgi:hypothetical protein
MSEPEDRAKSERHRRLFRELLKQRWPMAPDPVPAAPALDRAELKERALRGHKAIKRVLAARRRQKACRPNSIGRVRKAKSQ